MRVLFLLSGVVISGCSPPKESQCWPLKASVQRQEFTAAHQFSGGDFLLSAKCPSDFAVIHFRQKETSHLVYDKMRSLAFDRHSAIVIYKITAKASFKEGNGITIATLDEVHNIAPKNTEESEPYISRFDDAIRNYAEAK